MFSSANNAYISRILKILDPKGKYFADTLCFDDCTLCNGFVLKILKRITSLSEYNYVLIDDNIANVLANQGNSILISPYTGNPLDFELLKLLEFLKRIKDDVDIRAHIDNLYFK